MGPPTSPWFLPEGRPGPTRSQGHPLGCLAREKMAPLLCPGQPLTSRSTWDPSSGAEHQRAFSHRPSVSPNHTPAPIAVSRLGGTPEPPTPTRPSASWRSLPVIPCSPKAAPSSQSWQGTYCFPAGSSRVATRSHLGLLTPPPPSQAPQHVPCLQCLLLSRAARCMPRGGPRAELTGRGTCAPAG